MTNALVYLPLEVKSRELISKVLLACKLVERGFTVVLGQQWILYETLPRLPLGTFLVKSLNEIHNRAIATAKAYGHRVVAHDEEMLAHSDPRAYENYYVKVSLDLPDLILVDGQFHLDALRRLGKPLPRVEITGNGRVDILKPRFQSYYQIEMEDIRERFGTPVLINTNFATTNSFWGNDDRVFEIAVRAGIVDPSDPESVAAWKETVETERTNRDEILKVIRALALEKPQQKIVIRPHPGERIEYWADLPKEYSNVSIVREGAHIPWTLSSRLLLHTACTTGLEAYVAGRPAISLLTRQNWHFDSSLANRVNPFCKSASDCVAMALRFLDTEILDTPAPDVEDLSYFVWNIGRNNATERIVELLTSGIAPKPAPPPPIFGAYARPDVLREKFSLTLDELKSVLGRILKIENIATEFKVSELADSLFLLQPGNHAHLGPAVVPVSATPDFEDGIAAFRRGEPETALEAFKACLKKNPEHLPSAQNAGAILFNAGRYHEAEPFLMLAAKLSPVADNLLPVAALLTATGRDEAAIRLLGDVLAVAPDNVEALQSLAAIAERHGDRESLNTLRNRIATLAAKGRA